MRLVNFDEFMTLPEGTVYQSYSPHIVGDLCIKSPFLDSKDDFMDAALTPISVMPEDKLCLHLPSGFGRWGLFDKSAQFIVYEDADRERLARWLLNPNQAVEEMNDDPVVDIVIG